MSTLSLPGTYCSVPPIWLGGYVTSGRSETGRTNPRGPSREDKPDPQILFCTSNLYRTPQLLPCPSCTDVADCNRSNLQEFRTPLLCQAKPAGLNCSGAPSSVLKFRGGCASRLRSTNDLISDQGGKKEGGTERRFAIENGRPSIWHSKAGSCSSQVIPPVCSQ